MRWAIWLLLLLAACGRAEPPPFTQRTFANELRVARIDFQAGRYGFAADGFARALQTAWSLDDAAAIGTAGGEEALSLLRDDRPGEAAQAADRLTAELARRGAAIPALVDLVAGAAALRLGDPAAVAAVLGPRTDDPDPAVRARAWYLLGLAADARSDVPALAAALAGLEPLPTPAAAADRDELEARLALRQGRPDLAAERLVAVRAARRDADDLDGLGEALALSAAAAAAAGEPLVAADFYLRAARNAAARGRTARALAWLDQAQRTDARGLEADIGRLRQELGAR